MLMVASSPCCGRWKERYADRYSKNSRFLMFHPEKLPCASKRCMLEVNRTLTVLDGHLAKSPGGYLVGDKFTWADALISHY